jgi:hypothetical protein
MTQAETHWNPPALSSGALRGPNLSRAAASAGRKSAAAIPMVLRPAAEDGSHSHAHGQNSRRALPGCQGGRGSAALHDGAPLPHDLDRVREALRPRGLRVVHEKMKAPSYTADLDKMFTVEELDGLLGRNGRIDRFLSTGTLEVNKAQAREKTGG